MINKICWALYFALLLSPLYLKAEHPFDRNTERLKIEDKSLYDKEGLFEVKVQLINGIDPEAWLANYYTVEIVKDLSYVGSVGVDEDGNPLITTRFISVYFNIDQRTLSKLEADLNVKHILNRSEPGRVVQPGVTIENRAYRDRRIAEIEAKRHTDADHNFPKVRDTKLYDKEGLFKVKVTLIDGIDPEAWLANYGKVEIIEDLAYIGNVGIDENGDPLITTKHITIRLNIDQRTLSTLEADLNVRAIHNKDEPVNFGNQLGVCKKLKSTCGWPAVLNSEESHDD